MTARLLRYSVEVWNLGVMVDRVDFSRPIYKAQFIEQMKERYPTADAVFWVDNELCDDRRPKIKN